MASSLVLLVKECQKGGIFSNGSLAGGISARELTRDVGHLAKSIEETGNGDSILKVVFVSALHLLANTEARRTRLKGLLAQHQIRVI